MWGRVLCGVDARRLVSGSLDFGLPWALGARRSSMVASEAAG
jgi:hypothetical protein